MNPRHLTGFLHELLEPRSAEPEMRTARMSGVAGRAFRSVDGLELAVLAHSSASARAAERLRLSLIDGAARLHTDDRTVASPVQLLDAPIALPASGGTFLAWGTQRGSRIRHWVAGYLRRGCVTWEVLASAPSARQLPEFVGDVAAIVIARQASVGGGTVWDMLPAAGHLPVSMWLDATLGAPLLDPDLMWA